MTVSSAAGAVLDRGERIVEVGEAGEALVEILDANRVDCLFVMPGDAFPILEAIARRQATGARAPRVITVPHETVGLAAAHGHFMVSGRPQACLFHADVGLQMAGGMLHNAQRARAGVVIMTGRTPMSFRGEMRGGRALDVHWMQDRRDQPGAARDYVKWCFDLTRTEVMSHVVQRAFQVAGAEPAGPVYLSLLREMLLEPMGKVLVLPPDRYAVSRPGVPSQGDLDEIANLLLTAERPVAITGYIGRRASGYHALGELADMVGLPVFVRPERANIASDHPMYLGTDAREHLAQADLVLLLDVDVPYVPGFERVHRDATVVHLDVDALKTDIPVWGFPVDISLQVDAAATLPALRGLLRDRTTEKIRARMAARRAAVEGAHRRYRAELRERAEAGARATPIDVHFLSACVADLVDDGTIVVDDSTTARGIAAAYMPNRNPGSYFQPSGSSMGWGSGAALGAKLAAPEKTVLSLNADGNFISGAPEAALWAAARHHAPFLTVIYNNASYAAIKLGWLHTYPDGFAARTKNFPGVDLAPSPAFAQIARACGAHGEHVTDPAALRGALARALAAVRGGQPAVVDAAVAGP